MAYEMWESNKSTSLRVYKGYSKCKISTHQISDVNQKEIYLRLMYSTYGLRRVRSDDDDAIVLFSCHLLDGDT